MTRNSWLAAVAALSLVAGPNGAQAEPWPLKGEPMHL